MPAAERLHGRLPDPHAALLEQVVGEFGVRPVGAVEAAGGRAADDPPAQDRGQVGGQPGRGTGRCAGFEPVEPALQVGVEPPLDGARGDAQVACDVLVGPAPVGQSDDLEAVVERAVGCGGEGQFQAALVRFGQVDANHGCPVGLTEGELHTVRDQTPSAGF